jgi:hypothetical protein
MKQRGFACEVIDPLINYGREYYRHGAVAFLGDTRCIKKLQKQGLAQWIIEKCKGSYVVLSEGVVITVGHKTKHFKR